MLFFADAVNENADQTIQPHSCRVRRGNECTLSAVNRFFGLCVDKKTRLDAQLEEAAPQRTGLACR